MSGIMLNIVGATYGSGILAIGDAYEGGFYAGQISTAETGVANYNLVVGPVASAQTGPIQWKTSNTNTVGASSLIDGPANSIAMNDPSHPGAYFCKGLTIGGFSDWYMAAKNELEICYYNLKPTTRVNNTASGINNNAVPIRTSNYTAGTPAQTSAANFKTSSGSQAFTDSPYWASTQNSAVYAVLQSLDYGVQYSGPKIATYGSRRVRAIRRVAV
jgi:hypothetical protein